MNEPVKPDSDAHAEEEFAAFRSFASIVELSVDDIRKMRYPRPDLRVVVDGNVWAVELTRAVDPDVMERHAKLMRTQTMLNDAEEQLNSADRERFLGTGGSLSIAVNFNEESSIRARSREIPRAIEHLLSLTPDLPEETHIPGCSSIDIVRIYRAPNVSEGILDLFVGSGGYVKVPLAQRISAKLNKPYERGDAAQAHLVVYAWINLLLPPDTWCEEIDELLAELLPKSKFDRVWVVDLNAREILYRYPNES